jgi:high-affinity iron transporter
MLFANFLIGLREGLEAALVVSILIAYLVKSNRRDKLVNVWIGTGAALVLSVGLGFGLQFMKGSYLESEVGQDTFAGITSVIAVALVTSMIFWMRNTGRKIAAEMRDKMDKAIQVGTFAVISLAFIAVAREGLETAVFFFSAVQSAGNTTEPLIGFGLGIVTALVLAWFIYQGAIRLNLSKFFTYTGYLLIFVAAGVLLYGIHELSDVGILPGAGVVLYDISGIVSLETWYGALLNGLFNFRPVVTWIEGLSWLTYVLVVIYFFAKKPKTVAKPAEEKVAVSV